MLQTSFFANCIFLSKYFQVFCFFWFKPWSSLPKPGYFLVKISNNWAQWALNLCKHACLHTDHCPTPYPHTNTHTTVPPSSNKLQCIHSGVRSHPLRRVSLHHWKCTIPSRLGGVGDGGGGVMGLQVYNTQTASSACISATCLTSVLYLGSKEEQRAAEARRLFKSNTGYSGFIGDWTKACVRGFSTTCAALSSVLCYRFIPCAAECCALCHIKGTGLRVWQNAGAVEENGLL